MNHLSPRRQGFTLVEIMIVVVIIGLLATMLMPAFNRVRQASQNTRFVNDTRTMAGAIDVFMLENGVPPDDYGSGVIGPPLDEYIKSVDFENGTSLGGVWDVEGGDGGLFMAAVGVDGFSVAEEQIERFDEQYDDGDTSTGLYQIADGDRYYRVIEE